MTPPSVATPATSPAGSPPARRRATAAVTALAATVLLAATAAPAAADPTAVADLDPQTRLVLDETNAARAAAGCAPLLPAVPLQAAAVDHSAEMARTGVMTHSGADGSTPRVRLLDHGVSPRRTAENVAVGFDAAGVVDAWLASPGHRAAILDCRLDVVGIAGVPGAGGLYWTQVFAGV